MELPTETMLHHHAHAAACLMGRGWPSNGGDVITLTLDGIDVGENGALWGGECLRVSYRECEYLGDPPTVALAGGDLAAEQSRHNLLAQCLRFVPGWQCRPETSVLQHQNWNVLACTIERGTNAPLASSCGRLLNAVATVLQCVPESLGHEGEAACTLKTVVSQCDDVDHPVIVPLDDNQLDLVILWQQWLNWQVKPAERAWAFHDVLTRGFATLMRAQAEIHRIKTLVFSGGVMHNRLLSAHLAFCLRDFTLLFPQRLPAGDDGLPLGQGVITVV